MSKAQKISQPAKNTKTTITSSSLHTWNKWLALLYAVQAVAILVLSTAKTVPLTVSYLAKDTLASEAAGETVWSLATRTVADINLAYLIAAFLLIAAIAHASAAWWCRTRFYEPDLEQGVNRLRWYTAAAVGSLMLVTVAMLAGVSDLTLLVAIIALGAIAGLSGLALEAAVRDRVKSAAKRLACWVGSLSALMPWIIIAIYLAGASLYGAEHSPAYALTAAGLVLLFFVGQAFNFKMQLKQHGKWKSYLYAECLFIGLSFVAASALAWYVYLSLLAA